jgi:hypothetical protein
MEDTRNVLNDSFYFKAATALYSKSHNVTLYDSAEADPAGRTPKLTDLMRTLN